MTFIEISPSPQDEAADRLSETDSSQTLLCIFAI